VQNGTINKKIGAEDFPRHPIPVTRRPTGFASFLSRISFSLTNKTKTFFFFTETNSKYLTN